MTMLDDLPAAVARTALNESCWLDGVFEADSEPQVREDGSAVGYVTNDEGDQLRITVEYVPETHDSGAE